MLFDWSFHHAQATSTNDSECSSTAGSSTSPKEAQRYNHSFISLHWHPKKKFLAARIKFKTLMLAYRTTTATAPAYLHSLLQIYTPSRTLRSASERRLVVPSQRGHETKSMLNNSGPRYKRSKIERKMNTDVLFCVVLLFFMCLIGALGHAIWLETFTSVPSYIVPDSNGNYTPSVLAGFYMFFTMIILLQVRNLSPAQLILSMFK
ncbi:hypothetical protein QQF64_007619 [Cirrhinus molitorella]|uniref:Uncharacterized protein n=1 Tax=Cirrhinus molitorella TaxID=172907 RepID=A0ABR3MB47_9TELE